MVNMRCSRFRKLTVIISHSERSLRLQQQLDEHEQSCPACREFTRRMQTVQWLLREVPAEQAPEGFTDQLRQRLGRANHQQRLSWYEKLRGVLKPPAPIIQPAAGLAAAAAIVMVIFVGGLFLRSSHFASPLRPAVAPTVASSSAAGVGLAEIPGDSASHVWDEALYRHRRYALNRPLADDPGMQLISYPLSPE